MPIPKEPYDFEYMQHQPYIVALGEHNADETCAVEAEERGHYRFACTRESGHMGRHEAGTNYDDEGRQLIAASWAHKP